MKTFEKPNSRHRLEDALALAKELYGPGISIFYDDKCIDKLVIDLRYGSLSSIYAECNKVKIIAEDGHAVYFPIQNKVVEYSIEDGIALVKGKLP